MAKKNEAIVWIGAAAVVLYFLLKKKKPQPVEKSVQQSGGQQLTLTAYPNNEDYFKALYSEDQKNC
jgi:hypothetical protein